MASTVPAPVAQRLNHQYGEFKRYHPNHPELVTIFCVYSGISCQRVLLHSTDSTSKGSLDFDYLPNNLGLRTEAQLRDALISHLTGELRLGGRVVP